MDLENPQAHDFLSSPANRVLNPQNPTQGYGRLRHFNRMKREQFQRNAHPPLTVRWDEVDLSSIVRVLEACGDADPLSFQQTNIPSSSSFGSYQLPERRFDPYAPHFDVILVDLTNIADTLTADASPYGLDISGLNLSEQTPALGSGYSRLVPGTGYGHRKSVRFGSVRRDINTLPMESLAGRPGWVFLWVGPTENLVQGRRILGSWGFRKVECIGWMKIGAVWSRVPDTNHEDDENKDADCAGTFRNAVEWCLMGCKGSAKRTFDSHLIHCNANTDVMVSDSANAPVNSLLSLIIENFSLGQRRLHLFAKLGDERPGWITVGRDFEFTNFDCKKYLKTWGEFGRQGWLTPFDSEIEYFRPRTPPVQVRRRERAVKFRKARVGSRTSGGAGSGDGGRGRYDVEPIRFPHMGQRKRALWRLMDQTMQRAYALYHYMHRHTISFSADEGYSTTTFPALYSHDRQRPTLQQSGLMPVIEHGAVQRPLISRNEPMSTTEQGSMQGSLMDTRVPQLSGDVLVHQWPQQAYKINGQPYTFQFSGLAKQFHPGSPVPSSLQQSPVEPVQPQIGGVHPSIASVQQQMMMGRLNPFEPQAQPAYLPGHEKAVAQPYLRNMPVMAPIAPPGITISPPSAGGDEYPGNKKDSHLPESSNSTFYTYTRPIYTPPERAPELHHNAPATAPRATDRPMFTANSGYYAMPQETRAGFPNGQAYTIPADTGARHENRQVPQRPPGLGGPPIANLTSLDGQALHTLDTNIPRQSSFNGRVSSSQAFEQYRSRDSENPGMTQPVHSSPGHHLGQRQPRVYGGFGALRPGVLTENRIFHPDTAARFEPMASYLVNSSGPFAQENRQQQRFNSQSGNNGRAPYTIPPIAPPTQQYVRGENGEFVTGNYPPYQQPVYPERARDIHAEHRQQLSYAESYAEKQALAHYHARIQTQNIIARANARAAEDLRHGRIPSYTPYHF